MTFWFRITMSLTVALYKLVSFPLHAYLQKLMISSLLKGIFDFFFFVYSRISNGSLPDLINEI